MSRNPNVEALVAIMRSWLVRGECGAWTPARDDPNGRIEIEDSAEAIAEALAAAGVLAVDSLTDEQAEKVLSDISDKLEWRALEYEVKPIWLRAALRRCATEGE